MIIKAINEIPITFKRSKKVYYLSIEQVKKAIEKSQDEQDKKKWRG